MTTNTNTPAAKADYKELGVLWKRTKKGTNEAFLTGTINLKEVGFDKDVQVVVFTNKSKKQEKHPDLRVYLSLPRPAFPVAGAAPAATAPVARKTAAPAAPAPTPQDNEII